MPFSPTSLLRLFSALALALNIAHAALDAPSGDFLVRAWQSEDGLPGNALRSVVQAADGYLWVATAEGLVRFDGVRFSGFSAEADAALATLPMRALFPMGDGDVWVATAAGGLLRWDQGRLREILHPPDEAPLPQNESVTQVIADGTVGVIAFRGTETWRVDSEPPQQVERTPQIDRLRSSDAEAWLRRGRASSVVVPPTLVDSTGRAWTVNTAGLLTAARTDAASSPVPLPMTEGGLRVAEFCEDREGNIWVATGESGLIQIRPRRVKVISVSEGLSDRTASSVLQDRTGAWWIGSKGGGVDRLAKGVVSHLAIGEGGLNRPVSVLFEDREGKLWAATRNGSVFHLENGAFRPVTISDAPSKIAGMAQDSRGALWFGGAQGLACFADERFTKVEVDEPLDVTALALDRSDRLWVGTSQGKVYVGESGKFHSVEAFTSAPARAISSFHIDKDDSVWMTSVGGGLSRWKAGTVVRFDVAAGLPDARLTSVIEDGAGNLWLGSLAGIFRVAKAELDAVAQGRRPAAAWLQLDRADGLLSRETTGIFQPAAWRGRDGELWFPTVSGVATIRPDALHLNPLPPPVTIEACSENGNLVPLAPERLRFGPGRTRLEFRYTALSLTASEKVRFRVRLLGLETEWRDAGIARTAAYEAVPPGQYTFEVIAANADGLWAQSPAALQLEVRPHFWETKTFRILLALLGAAAAAGVGWLMARARMRRRFIALELQHAREAERSRIAQDLHDDLGASLTEISMLADVTAEDIPSEAARAPLEQIAARAHALVGALDEIVWAVNPRHDTLVSLADYLAATCADLLAAADMAFRLDVPRDLPAREVDAERRHTLLLAVREAMHNVVKHSKATEVWLRISIVADLLEIVVEDNGRGFAPAELPRGGEGLVNLPSRLAAIGGECVITSAIGSGTRVTLRAPLAPAATSTLYSRAAETAYSTQS